MKSRKVTRTTFVALFLGALLAFAGGVSAQTPDGQTPAEETVCDPLRADGVTKGLYGLCVAFCEAQDHAALPDPITQAELEELEDGSPSGKILTNYDRKKSATDPDMPCIKVEEPCPCWDSSELNAAVLDLVNGQCTRYNNPSFPGSYVKGTNAEGTSSLVSVLRFGGRNYTCQINDLGDPNVNRRFRITPEKFAACDAQLRQAQTQSMLTCTDVN